MLEIKVPAVGESITSGILGVWSKPDGAYVKAGEPLFEIETDKVTSEVVAESPASSSTSSRPATRSRSARSSPPSTKKRPLPSRPKPPSKKRPMGRLKKPRAPKPPRPPPPAAKAPANSPRCPLPDRGKRNRPRFDLRQPARTVAFSKATSSLRQNPARKPPPKPGRRRRWGKSRFVCPAHGGADLAQENDAAAPEDRRALLAAQQETAHLTTFNEVDLSNIIALRAKYQDRFVKKHEVKLGFMSFFVKAVVHALQTVPAVNARLDGDEIIQNNYFDIGVAVSTEKGLLVPVIRDADRLTFAGIEKEIGAYAKKARDGKIQLSDLDGGVFTITNGGVFGSLLSTPILNPPQCGILGMHTIQERPVAINAGSKSAP